MSGLRKLSVPNIQFIGRERSTTRRTSTARTRSGFGARAERRGPPTFTAIILLTSARGEPAQIDGRDGVGETGDRGVVELCGNDRQRRRGRTAPAARARRN